MLKSSTGKLYTLLYSCKPDNAKVAKRLLITEILEMPEYRALQVYQGASSVMDDYYSPEKLKETSYEQLQEIKSIITFLEDCIRKLYSAICYGNVSAIRKIQEINFYSAESMKNLYEVVSKNQNTGMNITNIAEYDVWSIFSENTIVSIEERMDLFDSKDVESLESQVTEKLKDYVYCISSYEIAAKRKAYRSIYINQETIRIRLQIVENKIFVKKLILSFISLLIVMSQLYFGMSVFNAFEKALALLLYCALLIIYWILG